MEEDVTYNISGNKTAFYQNELGTILDLCNDYLYIRYTRVFAALRIAGPFGRSGGEIRLT